MQNRGWLLGLFLALTIAALGVLGIDASAQTGATIESFYANYTSGTAVGETNKNVVFRDNHSGSADTTKAFSAKTIWIKNDNASGGASVFVDVADGVATTADREIKPGEAFELGFGPRDSIDQIGLICDSGQTASVRVSAIRTRD